MTPTYTPAYGTHFKGYDRDGTLVPRPADASPGIVDDALWIQWDDSKSIVSFSQEAFLAFFNPMGVPRIHHEDCTCRECMWGISRYDLLQHYVHPITKD